MASPIPQKDDVESWTVEQVAAWLRQMELTDCCEFFLRRGIDGRSLMELTEEGLILWGRDVSIRNRKKVMKLVRQIENQHLISTGKLQPSQVHSMSRHTSNGGRTSDADYSDDDTGFLSDEFDDVQEEPFGLQHDENDDVYGASPGSDSKDNFYMIPKPGPTHRNDSNPPSPPPRPLRRQPIGSQGSLPCLPKTVSHPEKRRPVPLPPIPFDAVQQISSQKIMGSKLLPGQRDQAPTVSSSLDPMRHAPLTVHSSGAPIFTKPIARKPNTLLPFNLKTAQSRDWPPKKSTEPSNSQNSNQPESSNEGPGLGGRMGLSSQHSLNSLMKSLSLDDSSSNKRGNFLSERLNKKSPQHSNSFPREDIDDAYETVESPPGIFTGNESHSGSPPGRPLSSQEPPPLPERNQDGTGLQQPLVSSSVGHNRITAAAQPSRSTSSTGTPKIIQNRPPPPLPVSNFQDRAQPSPFMPNQPHPRPNVNSPPLEIASAVPPSAPSLLNTSSLGQHSVERIGSGEGDHIKLKLLHYTLMDRPFFHIISRKNSIKLLEKADDGVYLIRPSKHSSCPLTLCLRYRGRTYNINIRQRHDSLYALGTIKVNEMTFNSIDDIVSTHTNQPIKLQSGGLVTLTTSPAKNDHIYVRMPESFKKK